MARNHNKYFILNFKNFPGAGYHMVMTKSSNCEIDKVDAMLTKHIPDAKLESME